jgi:hypothetical protein
MSWENYFAKGFGGNADGSTMIGQKMLTNERMQEMMDYLAGGCHMSGIRSAVDNVFDGELTDEEYDQLEKFLEDNDCYECENCGWQTHPGEGCDCENDQECSECGNPIEECDCDD